MHATSRSRRPRHILAARALALAAIAFAGLTCRDGGVTGPGLPRWGRAELAPTIRAARVGPSIRLGAVRAQLIPLPIVPPSTGEPALDTTVQFGSGDQLQLELALPITDPEQEFRLVLEATEQGGEDVTYRVIDTVRLSLASTPAPVAMSLLYAGPDTLVDSIAVAPRDSLLVVGDSVRVRAVAFHTGQQAPLTGVRFGFALGDSANASISSTGMLRATRAFTGTWVYVGTLNGRVDSTRVSAFVPVRRVDLNPPVGTVAVGDTIALTASTFDRNDQLITGRVVSFQSLDTTAAVTATGKVAGRAPGLARIVATSEGVADTSTITVIQQPATGIVLAPDTARIARGDSLDLVATVRDKFGNVLVGRAITFTSTAPDTATVSGTGRVRALVASGRALVIATVEGRADTTVVLAQPRPATSVTISPDSMIITVGGQGALTAVALDAQGQPAPDFGVAWSSLDPGIATVSAGAGVAGDVTGVAPGFARIVARVGTVADTITVRVRAPATEIVISPSADTLEIPALGNDTLRLAAQAFDGGTPVPGARFGWTSRAPSVATVDTAGMVRSVATGHAWIVATEPTSGLQDSVLVRVVQRVARVAVTPDTITVPGVGQPLTYAAVAYDRNGVAVPVPAFTWATTGGGVASIDSVTGPNAYLHTTGNGTVQVTATVDGITGSGRLTVAQQLASIVVNPTTVSLGSGGTALLVAEGRDVFGASFAAPLAFQWRSDDASVATVDPVTGRVTAVSTGTAHVTASVGSITSNQVLVNVSALAILFEADTIAVGSRTEVQTIVRLGAPSAVPVGVGFFFADTGVAAVGVPYGQVTFPAGVTTQLVPLQGRMLGSVRLRAVEVLPGLGCDGACPPRSDPVYAPDTTTVIVIAGLQLEVRGELALGDSTEAQLALQTPAPPGGLVVTFDYDMTGIARVVPDTVVVPGGHLGVAVTLRTLAQGIVRITPRVVGAADPPGIRSTLQVGPPMMDIANVEAFGTPITIGAGQSDLYAAFALLRVPPSGTLPIAVASRRGVVTVPASVEVPGGQYGRYLPIAASQPGVDTIVATAAAPFGTAIAPVIVTTPALALRGEYDSDTLPDVLQGYGEDYDYDVSLVVTDSLGRRHPRGTRLTVRLVSSNPAVLRPIQEFWVIEPGDDMTSLSVRLAGSGSATLTLSADGHVSASKTVQVRLPKLALSWEGELAPDDASTVPLVVNRAYPDAVQWWTESTTYSTFTVDVRHTNRAAAGPDTSLTYDYGTGYGIIPLRTLAAGTDTLVITRAGFEPDTVVLLVRDADRATLESPPDTVQVGEPIFLQVRLNDRGVPTVARTVRVRSVTPALLVLDTLVRIEAGQRNAFYFNAAATATGTARIELSTGGVVDTTYDVVVLPGRIEIVTNAFVDTIPVGVGHRPAVQHSDQFIVRVRNASANVTMNVNVSPAGMLSVPSSIVLDSPQPGGVRVATLPMTGLAPGLATVVVSAPGYLPDTLVMRVVRPALIEDACEYCYPRSFPTSAKAGESFNWEQAIRVSDSVRAVYWDQRDARIGGFTNRLTGPVVFRVTSSNPAVVRSDSALLHADSTNGTFIPAIPIAFVGAGTATITVQDTAGLYLPFTRTVTVAPQLLRWQVAASRSGNTTGAPRATLGTRQSFVAYERPQLCTNGPVAQPFTVAVTSTDTVVGRAGAGTDTVTFATSESTYGSCTPIDIEGGTITGTVGIVARSVAEGPWSSDTLRLIVGKPTFIRPASWYYGIEADTLWLGDTTGRAFEFQVADQAGNPRLTLDTLALMASVTGTGVLSVREPVGTFTIVPGDGGTGMMIRVAGTAAGRERVVLQDMRSAIPDARRYAVGRSAEIEVTTPYLRLANADNVLAPTAHQVNQSYDVRLPNGFTFPEGDMLWVRLRGDAALAVPDSVPYVGGGVPGLFTINGLGVGVTSNLVLEAPGFRPDTASLRFLAGNLALVGSGYFMQGDSVQVSLRVENAERYMTQSVTQAQDLTLQLPAGLAASDGTSRVTTVRIPAGTDRVDFWLVGTTVGAWRVRATHPDFAPFTSEVITVAARQMVEQAGR